jgi:8-oxo-dGTP pyrophosphatase MutT (NUDIX family)
LCGKEFYLDSFALETIAKLKELLARRTKVRYVEDSRKPSAVLIPFYYREGALYLLFTRRTQLVRYHKGEISFPGGGYHEEDDSLVQTALRETFEEIGLEPEKVEIIGELDDVPTRYSNYIITPFAGLITPPKQYKVSDFEICEMIEIPIEGLLTEGCFEEIRPADPTDVLDIPFVYHYQDKTITGATARILRQFLGIYRQAIG